MIQAEAFPLSWPQGYPRIDRWARRRSKFKCTFASARDGLISALTLMRASYPVISSNQPLRRDGLPSGASGYIGDCGVAVYFLWKGKQRVLACDKWDRVEDNLHAIELASQGYLPAGWTGTASAGIQRLSAQKLANIAKMERPRRPLL